jgi:ribonuclease HII
MIKRRTGKPQMPRRVKRAAKPPTFREETVLLAQGYSLVAGLDEAGRGPLAGPVVAGAVVLPRKLGGRRAGLIRDSKQMTPSQREESFLYLQEAAQALETGVSSSQEVDEMGIVAATRLAMRRALNSMALLPQFLLLDAFPLPGVGIPQKPIIHGDALCLSIAAASIVAKVTRDRIMREQDALYPSYGFARNKGYGTREHLRKLMALGPCPIHRYSFAPVRESRTAR